MKISLIDIEASAICLPAVESILALTAEGAHWVDAVGVIPAHLKIRRCRRHAWIFHALTAHLCKKFWYWYKLWSQEKMSAHLVCWSLHAGRCTRPRPHSKADLHLSCTAALKWRWRGGFGLSWRNMMTIIGNLEGSRQKFCTQQHFHRTGRLGHKHDGNSSRNWRNPWQGELSI